MFVKICGITDVAAAETCVEAGVDAMGFVFDPSPRQITPRQAAAISDAIPSEVLRVAVFRRPGPERVESVLGEFDADIVQADHGSVENIVSVGTLPVFHAGVDEPPDEGWFLYEGPVSGVGEEVDLDRAADWARRGEMILAGGLRPENVGHAIDKVRPMGVDVSSGVEADPGKKDPALIRSFVAAVRAAEERLVNT